MRHKWNELIYVCRLMVKSVIHTVHNKLHYTFYCVHKASCHFTFKFGIVSRVDVLDNQGSSSFKKFFEEELVKVENGKWISPHIYYVKPLNK